MSLDIKCGWGTPPHRVWGCGEKLVEPGALILSPPDNDGRVWKVHLCKGCYSSLVAPVKPSDVAPVPMILTCPACSARHIDVGEFATKVHHTHSCQNCGLTWRPAIIPTVGVQFLPGYKNS